MTFFAAKTIVAALFVAAGLTAALSMLTLLGRAEKRVGAAALRNTHRVAGYVFAGLLVVLAVMGIGHLRAAGDTLPLRGVLHWTLASLLVFLLALKLAVVRFYKQFAKFAPVMGTMVIVLALVVAAVSAGFFVIRGGNIGGGAATTAADRTQPGAAAVSDPHSASGGAEVTSSEEGEVGVEDADPSRGETLFRTYCAGCHRSDSTENRIGPGLAGFFGREKIEASGLPVTDINVRKQIVAPTGSMPAFESHLTAEQLDRLISYLKTL